MELVQAILDHSTKGLCQAWLGLTQCSLCLPG